MTTESEALTREEAALVADISIGLVLTVLADCVGGFADGMTTRLDDLLRRQMPTHGTQAAIQRLRDQIEALDACVH